MDGDGYVGGICCISCASTCVRSDELVHVGSIAESCAQGDGSGKQIAVSQKVGEVVVEDLREGGGWVYKRHSLGN